jgi:hypothetical protein
MKINEHRMKSNEHETSVEEMYYLKFLRDGLITWEEKDENYLNNVNACRVKVLFQSHTRISNLFSLDPMFTAFLKVPTLKYILNRIFKKEQYHLTTYSSNTLRKHDKDGRVFHVDYPYHNLQSPYPDEILGVQVIYALDDFTIENGATIHVPNSHLNHCFPKQEFIPDNAINFINVSKGSIIVYRGDMWHSQGINTTESPRVAS